VWPGPPGRGFSVGLTTLPSKKQLVQEQTNLPRDRVFGKSTGKRKKDLLFGTWNVRTLYKSGAVHNIVNEVEKYKVKLTALQEIRWTNTGTININETTIFYGGCTEQRQLGTGFAVHKDLVPAVKEFKDINPRMSVLTIEAQWFDISFVNVHAPTEDKSQDEKEAFYEQLENALNLIPSNRIQIVLGDLNAKVGKEKMFRQVTGGHSLHDETNDNGTKLIDFAIGNGLVIRSTMFPHKNIHKGTWRSPDGRYTNQIDHILVNSRFKNGIQDVRSIRGADSDSDHYLIRGKMKIKLKKRPHTRMEQLTRYDVAKLDDPNRINTFRHKIRQEFINYDFKSIVTVDEKWNKTKDILNKISDDVIGKQKKTKKPWFNDTCMKALKRKKETRKQWLNDIDNVEKENNYIICKKEVNNIIRYEKRRYTKNMLEETEEHQKMNRSRLLFQNINALRKGFKKQEKFLKNCDGMLITDPNDILDKWKDYFENLLNCDEPIDTFNWTDVEPNESEYLPPSRIEIAEQIKRLKNHKTPGEDGIQAEILKKLDEEAISNIHNLVDLVWKEEKIPEDWRTALVCPIYKKNDPLECNNYRGIALLNTTYKVLSYCILDRIKPISEGILGDYQGGFRPNRSTTDLIFTIRQIFQKMWEFDKEVYTLFVDFEKAYDSIHRPTLFKILKEFNMPKKLINLIKATMENSEIKIKVANSTSKPFKVTSGLRQGDALSPILFNLVLEKVVRDMNISEGVTLGQSKIGLLAYADDIAILGDNIEIVKIHCKKLMDAANKVGLRINDKKTEYMKLNRKDRTYRHGESMNVDGHIFQRVPQFKYLGVLLTQDNELKVEISKRMQLANNCYFGVGTLLKSRSISLNLKIKIYMTLIRPVVLYGSETWAPRKIEEIKLDTFERKILRRIYGPCFDSRTQEWRIRTNEELQNLFQRSCISNEIKKRRLLWAGHAWRKKDAMINTVIREEPKGKRPLGRPRLRWEDCVKKDVKEVDPGANWREIAENRISWREICFAGWS